MRILHLVSSPWFSGAVPPTLALAQAQKNLGHRVWLGFDTTRGDVYGYEEAAAPHIKAAGLESPAPMYLSTHSTPWQWFKDWNTLRQWLRQHHVDVVHCHLTHDHVLAACAISHPTLLIRTIHASRSLTRRLGQTFLHRRADGFITRTRAHTEKLTHTFSLPQERVAQISGSIDSTFFVPSTQEERHHSRQQLDIPTDALVVGHVAHFADRGQAELVQALAKLGAKAPWVIFVGSGPHQAKVAELAQSLGVAAHVKFLGYVQRPQLRQAYKTMDAVFLAQPGNDASARAALEAMACGLPVIAVQKEALAELIDHTVGYPIRDRTPTTIAESLRVLIDDQASSRHQRGQNARDCVLNKHQIDTEAHTAVAFYENCQSGKV